MSSPSNLYAEKVFSEHPIALWPLDDKADYLSFINEADRHITSWTVTGVTGSEHATDVLDEPFRESFTTRLIGEIPSTSTQIVAISNDLMSPSQMNENFSTFSIGAYFYAENSHLLSVEVGYEYLDGEVVSVSKSFSSVVPDRWFFVSETFLIPETTEDIRLVLKVNYNDESLSQTPGDYNFLVNGLSWGHWAEEFQTESLGVQEIDIPSDIATGLETGVLTNAYGLKNLPGYLITNNKMLMAKNTGVPMVYGASNITKIFPNNGDPSLIIPGAGFLNESGQFQDYTFEMWLRIDPYTKESKRIFGPLTSTDGLYVNGPFLTLKIDDNIASHYVGEWYRPMLINISLSTNSANLFINGELVIDLSFISANLSFPQKINLDESSEFFQKDQDWLGFYSYDDVDVFELDCIGIYPYPISNILAKRRWIYGQAVEYPENINSSFSGTSVVIDYPFSKYPNNYTYPEMGRWNQGIIENLTATRTALSIPQYELPQVVFNNKTESDLLADSLPLSDEFGDCISLRPNDTWDNTEGYVLFENLSFLPSSLGGFYGIFGLDSSTNKQILFKIENPITKESLEVLREGFDVSYIFKTISQESVIHSENYEGESLAFVGLDLARFISRNSKSVSSLLSNVSRLKIFVGGSDSFEKTFSGKIYKVGFSTLKNFQGILSKFDNDGLPVITQEVPLEHFATYTLIAKQSFGALELDIAINASWQDYLPLRHFGKNVTLLNNRTIYDVDFLQLNINYPGTNKTKVVEGKTYIDTADEIVKTYITFQYSDNSVSKAFSSFVNTRLLEDTEIVSPGSEWLNTRYEVIDNTIIYPPSNVNFSDISISVHIEVNIDGIKHKPLNIKSLQIASQALNEDVPNQVGTKFGATLFPYEKINVYYEYKAKNPFSIYKNSTPYLHLTKLSGIQVRGDFEQTQNRGLSIPINEERSEDYRLTSFQTIIKYDQFTDLSHPAKIFEVDNNILDLATNTYIKFFLESIDPENRRAKIYAINSNTGQLANGISYYWNGRLVKEPILTIDEWGVLGVGFSTPVSVPNAVGEIRINGNILVNNLSYYKAFNLQTAGNFVFRPWFDVKYFADVIELEWDYWYSGFSWEGVLVISSSTFIAANPLEIYRDYTGTNKLIVDDNKVLKITNPQYSVYTDLAWQTQVLDAV
jgi:hypothetical protein